MPRSFWLAFALLCALVMPLAGQTNLSSGPVVGPNGPRRHIVQDAGSVLWALSISEVGQTRALDLFFSTDGGATWSLFPFVFNSAASGLAMPNGTNGCSLAVDSSGRLHAIWGSYWYPSFFRQYYRWFDPATGLSSQETDLTAAVGAAVTSRTDAMCIEVDVADNIWIAAQGLASWSSVLLFGSAPLPVAPTFTNLGTLSASASSQAPHLCVDANGDVHAIYYRNVAPGILEHRRWMTQLGAFGPATTLGNTTAPQDYLGLLAADVLGNVHALYYVDTVSPSNWLLRYRKWTSLAGFGPEETLSDAPAAAYGTGGYATFALAAEASSGSAHVVFRDFVAGGAVRHLRKGNFDTSWTQMLDLAPASAGLNLYYFPSLRGSLYPVSNQVGSSLDLSYRFGLAAPFSLLHSRVSSYPDVLVSLAANPTLGTAVPIIIYSQGEANAAFVLAFALSSVPPVMLPDGRLIPLAYDFVFQLSLDPLNPFFQMNLGFLGPADLAIASITLPNSPLLSGLSLFAAAATGNQSASLGISRISPSLEIRFP